MRKTNRNIKFVKTTKALILCLFVVSLIFPFYLTLFKPKNYEGYPTVQISIEEKYLSGGRHSPLVLFSDGEYYATFHGNAPFKKALRDKLQIGGRVQITYEQSFHPFLGPYRHILDLRDENEVYIDFDDIYPGMKAGFIIGIVILALVEFVLLILLICNIIVFCDYRRVKKNKKAKKLNKLKE